MKKKEVAHLVLPKEENMKIDNELIAEFMGVKEQQGFYDSYGKDEPFWFTSNEIYRTESRSLPDLSIQQFIEESKYHTSWDWLMPVVEKIKLQWVNHQIKDVRKDIDLIRRYNRVISMLILSTIDEVYFEVVEFIKWHNHQTP